ncbi:PREDICTED: uncharacterized protein LOC105564661 isoform X2 [Vollenhovia emeryi]|uniref:uncharacterized protein LOC105564661 isoform X2 n=1 Tax=Vollenhovia emeryi TaxID=411798 RepID=UPI0005F44F76|nr:PREDICTED: uncharacterized protein LOC105564661 isoform X2 [Vollenhovia emeryi]
MEPRLLHEAHTVIVEQDFIGIYPDYRDNFLATFPFFRAKNILSYATEYRPDITKKTNDLPVNDDTLRALIVLSLLLLPSNSTKKNSREKGRGNNSRKKLQKT